MYFYDFITQELKKQPSRFNYTFFRGKKDQLIGGPVIEASDVVVSVRVVQAGKPDRVLQCPGVVFFTYLSEFVKLCTYYYLIAGGMNLRQLLVGNGINVYRSITRWTNCNGKQRCGTCIVDVSFALHANRAIS